MHDDGDRRPLACEVGMNSSVHTSCGAHTMRDKVTSPL